MNNLLDIKTPASSQADALNNQYGLDHLGLMNLNQVYWNLPVEALYEEAIFRQEGKITQSGALTVNTGKHTARAASDKFIVYEPETSNHIWWGQYNRPYETQKFDELYSRVQGYLQGKDVFVLDCFAGADPNYKLPIRVITEYAWHNLFARNMFILPETNDAFRRHIPEFTILSVPNFKSFPQIDGTPTNTFIVLNFEKRICIIGNTGYAGEIKKSVFSILNYLYPRENVLSMHCSANIGKHKDTALFFGLSGTGKTTLSADPNRYLIGDDEHGWSDEGVFNFEGGCYAKVIGLSEKAEPEIYACTRQFGTILENVIFDPVTRMIDLDNDERTENTRASYPLSLIKNSIPEKMGNHPKNIILLTCDASGVMPPIARLSINQTMYHFISGYTSKIAGTEIGLGSEPEITFSTCFGGPFMVHNPGFYARLLKEKITKYKVNCWLLNTGWVGGPYGIGKRISIQYTRTLLNAALDGILSDVEFMTDPIFGFEIPKTCPGVPESIMDPSASWTNRAEYLKRYKALASRFLDNYKKFADFAPEEVLAGGPHL